MSGIVRDLPASAFPFTIEIWAAGADRRGEPSWMTVCEGPGGVLIPAMSAGAWTRLSYADGSVCVVAPQGYADSDF